MTKATANIKKAASVIGATLTGKVGILSTLEGEHSQVSTLMKDALKAETGEEKRSIFQQVREELLIHMQGEEHGIYLELQKHEATRVMAERAIHQHGQVRDMLADLDQQTVGSAKWQQTLAAIQQAVEVHVEFEEHQIFVLAKDVVEHETLRDLDDAYQAFRDRVKRSGEVLRPSGGSTGTSG